MPVSNSPAPDDPVAIRSRARQAQGLKALIIFLLVSAVVFGVFVTAIPLPVRLFVAATDVILAAVLGLVLHQKFRK